MKDIPINRTLAEEMRLEEVVINNKLYSVYITYYGEICITDTNDKTKIFAIMSKELYNYITNKPSTTTINYMKE